MKNKIISSFAVTIVLINTSYAITNTPTSSCPIYLTLSPLSKNAEDSNIEINWGPLCENPPQWIGLYREDPSVHNGPPEVYLETHGKPNGYEKTNIKLGKIHLPGGWNHDEAGDKVPKRSGIKCLPFYVASFNGLELMSLDCLKIQPDWMTMDEKLSQMPLKELFIPGTHCSACYLNEPASRSQLLRKYFLKQNFDIWSQLVFGIRYLDINVGYYSNSSRNNSRKYCVASEGIMVMPIVKILQDIRKFVILSNEVVILDFSDFPWGFYKHPERHEEFLQILELELGDVAFRRVFANSNETTSSGTGGDLTLDEMRKAGKMLLITYNENEEEIVKGNNLVWPSWKKHSSDTLKIHEIREYMRNLFTGKHDESPKDIGWVFYGIQGPEGAYSATETIIDANIRAENVNRNIATWIGGPWSLNANVVAMDFFMTTNLIDIAIHTNHHKAMDDDKEVLKNYPIVDF